MMKKRAILSVKSLHWELLSLVLLSEGEWLFIAFMSLCLQLIGPVLVCDLKLHANLLG